MEQKKAVSALARPPTPPTSPATPRPPDLTPARFRGTRRAHQQETGEDYVEAIAQLIESSPESAGARVKDLALAFGVSHVTVVRIVSRLARRGLVQTSRGKPIVLTPRGRALARHAMTRHHVVLDFLLAIGVPLKQAILDAEGIEHHVSNATITVMQRVLKSRPGPAAGIRTSPTRRRRA
jgi:DtxR family manganese transport transcriptional regulator